ncbi:indolepyruvate ferredoxin oxidoreductase family protein [Rubrimonas cliftonensis]|uniref:Indolepyruvate ferredoxin oxidoreductase n=1 Tax=Rubrimonas cliftonensis TaxID=89524 RepID=A0A1H4BU57_9RHOB|nr:indolepyruvate ferredoxin oxidoreductase family protein [Rubrimonas cliftonensis]SEA51715.1 indolepyruvate ferredoxin oxidoreductase [Rubrimonas cliftonensis]
MDLRDVSLSDRFDLGKRSVLLSGVQALTRAALMQRARDAAAGLDTAGYVTGYRGSPLGAVDQTFAREGRRLAAAKVVFQPGLNEDLAATACWGTQQAQLRGEGRHAGVFAMWYGKGPGVDRTGDVFRHANFAGTAPLGGVLAVMGDDHTCESSTTCHQSDLAMLDAMIPVLSPAGVQEVLDFSLMGWALSRYAGLWVGLKCLKDTVEVVEVVDGDPHRLNIVEPPDFAMPEGGVSIRLHDTPQAQEARMHEVKRHAALAFARANGLDRRTHGRAGARIGLVASGKSWLDLVHALELLGIDEAACERLGLTVWKIGMVWPVEGVALSAWAEGLELMVVVEEKRPVIEAQIKEALYNNPAASRPRIIGGRDEAGRILFRETMALDPVEIALALAGLLRGEGATTPEVAARAEALAQAGRGANAEVIAERQPWFCAGCPHNSSTKLPEGARAYAGIGCHYMVQWMDRETEGFTHMGGEGANWIGEAHFSSRAHVFQNMGDGTYNHSGVQSIRAAVAAGTTITFKILYNDAVAMTGGQANEGGLDAYRIVEELRAMGVKRIVAVHDPKEAFEPARLPANVRAETRDRLMAVQRELESVPGVTAIVYVQTCAAEKRRRRKHGAFPDPDMRVFINPEVCEGCGDCSAKSNCVAVTPLETKLGRKRQIDQSACNKDFSCLEGFCPSFVTLHGAKPRKAAGASVALPDLPEPEVPPLDRIWNTVITGVGGTGVVTVGALLSMAAHLEGRGAGEMQMAGLAQKGGAVSIHVRIAPKPSDITAIRVSTGEADAVIGGDLVVAAGPKALATMARGRTGVVCNEHEIVTGRFVKDGAFSLPSERLRRALEARVGADAVAWLDATRLAEKLVGDAIYANVLMLGAAWQRGLVPLSRAALMRAIELNGAGVEGNKLAFGIGRWAAVDPAAARAALGEAAPLDETLDALISDRAARLTAYQSRRWARRFEAAVAALRAAEARVAPGAEALTRAAAVSLHKLMSYKDEYEVARLHAETLRAAVAEGFEGVERIELHLAPPLLARKGPDGHPRKASFGPWMLRAFGLLRRGKALRGTPLDPFGWTAERRMERRLISEFRADLVRLVAKLTPESHALAVEMASWPQDVKGFGHVKAANAARADARRAQLWEAFDRGGAPLAQAAE